MPAKNISQHWPKATPEGLTVSSVVILPNETFLKLRLIDLYRQESGIYKEHYRGVLETLLTVKEFELLEE